MDLKEIGVSTRNCVVSAQDGVLLNAALNFRVLLSMELDILTFVDLSS